MSRGFCRRYEPEHLLRCIRSSRAIGNKENAKQNVVDQLQYLYPSDWQARLHTTEVLVDDMVSHWTACRTTVQLDQVAMLWNRAEARRRGAAVRYISFDASPQHGQEVFVTVERVVARAALHRLGQHERPAVESRTLPVCILGVGRMGLAEKSQTPCAPGLAGVWSIGQRRPRGLRFRALHSVGHGH